MIVCGFIITDSGHNKAYFSSLVIVCRDTIHGAQNRLNTII